MGQLRFGVLGPVVVQAETEVLVPRRRQRLLLARLIVDAGRVVPTERLAEETCGTRGVSPGTGAVRNKVWELRRLLGSGNPANGGIDGGRVLASRDGGYVLDVDPEQVDSRRFERLLSEARALAGAGRDQGALDALDQAVGLRRGPAFDDLAGELTLQVEATRLDQLAVDAQELRAELMLAGGRHVEVASELGPLVRVNPERERLWGLLMTALYRSGRQVDALRCYQEARTALVDEVGVEPGPELRDLEQAVLRQDAALDRSPRVVGLRAGRLTSEGTPGHNLPRPITGLVGRATERQAVADALVSSRLVSLVGPGGCGKTRLAVAVAEDVLPRFPAGIWFVDLSGASTGDSVPGVVAAVLGGEGSLMSADVPAHETSWGAADEALLVLDNCEHLLGPVADYVSQLLDGASRFRVLATSREELRVAGETVCRVFGLGLPLADPKGPYLGSEAVELFVRRGSARLAGFAPGDATLAEIAAICRRLDGLPLAIELAAPLVGSLPVAEIARRVEERCSAFADARRGGALRHHSLAATIDWSFGLLDSPVQDLFAQLGVFAGGFAPEHVEIVVGQGVGGQPVAERLDALVRASLVEPMAGPDGVRRYRMLETVREYAVDRLEQRADAVKLRKRHAHLFGGFAVEADQGMRGLSPSRWRAAVEADLSNVRVALRWAMANEDVELGFRIVTALRWFLYRLASPDELDRWLGAHTGSAALTRRRRLDFLTTSAMVSLLQNEHERAGHWGWQAVAATRTLDDDRHSAIALVACGAAALRSGDLPRAQQHFDDAHSLSGRLGDRWGRGWALVGGATRSYEIGHRNDAWRQMAEARDVFRSLGDLHSLVVPLVSLALLALEAGKPQDAVDLASEAVHVVTVVEFDELRHVALCVHGLAQLSLGQVVRARELMVSSLRRPRSGRNEAFVVAALEGLAVLATAARRPDVAARLFGVAQRERLRLRQASSPRWDEVVDTTLDVVRRRLGPERADHALQSGRHMPLDDALAAAEAATLLFEDQAAV